MITLEKLRQVRLQAVPWGQIAVAELALRWNFALPPRTEIVLEGVERIPRDRQVFFALNHTDRYNYWPFQYAMYRHGGLPYTAAWVKGKYYEQPLLAAFLGLTNNIPLPSRGYQITTSFRACEHRLPGADEYRFLRDVIDGSTPRSVELEGQSEAVRAYVRRFGPGTDGLARLRDTLEAEFAAMVREVTRLTREALAKKLNLLVFPEGTRSVTLGKGLTGLAQMSQHLGVTIVPVGCNGSDRIYRSGSPWAHGGRVVYRVGEPLALDGAELMRYRVKQEFEPFSHAASARFGREFEAITAVVMDRLNELLDERHRRRADGKPTVAGIHRFV
jgi:1-acyl-sn-glycerol-3-phosphate acyltransferase